MKRSLLYVIVFIAVQVMITLAVSLVLKQWFPAVDSESGIALTVTTIIINVLVIILFLGFRWYKVSRDYIRMRPWIAMIWTALLAIGIIIPLAFIEQMIPEAWRQDNVGEVLVQMLQTTEGYFAVCMLGPLAEEIVFRGAIITALQSYMLDKDNFNLQSSIFNLQKWRMWVPILVSACFFSAIHFNPAQMPHAFLMGLLLGWLFSRTGSIVLCFLVHWINNSAAYVTLKLFPNVPLDADLSAYFGGSETAVVQAVVCSLMVALPALYQLHRLLDNPQDAEAKQEHKIN
ncbi:MAG: CPBP family intramembrane metalloprotease [Prevotella sp.]|nr:CPBP family intramembrane metalloprotease [Prevotella sp.]